MPKWARSVLADGYGGEWSSARALAAISRGGFVDHIPALAQAAAASCQPCDPEKLKKRLTVTGMAMAPNRAPAEATAWLHELSRLLGDLPEDIVFEALDIHQRKCRFPPTVAEIREIADPIMEKRRKETARLDAMARFLASGQPIPQMAVNPPKRHVMDPCGEALTPAETEELNAILARIGASTRYRNDGSRYTAETESQRKAASGPRRMPTRQDYIDMGVDPAALDGHPTAGGE